MENVIKERLKDYPPDMADKSPGWCATATKPLNGSEDGDLVASGRLLCKIPVVMILEKRINCIPGQVGHM